MVIHTTTYADFKALVSALLTTPVVYNYDNIGVFWYAMAVETSVLATNKIAVTCTLTSDIEPPSFNSDYPAHSNLTGPISVS